MLSVLNNIDAKTTMEYSTIFCKLVTNATKRSNLRLFLYVLYAGYQFPCKKHCVANENLKNEKEYISYILISVAGFSVAIMC